MIGKLLEQLRGTVSNDGEEESRRSHARRSCDKCVGVIEGQTFPVENWSQGGVLLSGDERLFELGQDVPLTLKFKVSNDIIRVEHTGKIVRRNNRKFAVRFDTSPKEILQSFQQVIDDYVTREFAESQRV